MGGRSMAPRPLLGGKEVGAEGKEEKEVERGEREAMWAEARKRKWRVEVTGAVIG
jgi:hypothetical protein